MEDKQLMWALKTGDLDEVVNTLITAEDVNRTLEGGRKPLHYAADYGQTEVMNYLISKGADVNASDKHGLTPLLCACFEGHLSCVQILIEKFKFYFVARPEAEKIFCICDGQLCKYLFKEQTKPKKDRTASVPLRPLRTKP